MPNTVTSSSEPTQRGPLVKKTNILIYPLYLYASVVSFLSQTYSYRGALKLFSDPQMLARKHLTRFGSFASHWQTSRLAFGPILYTRASSFFTEPYSCRFDFMESQHLSNLIE